MKTVCCVLVEIFRKIDNFNSIHWTALYAQPTAYTEILINLTHSILFRDLYAELFLLIYWADLLALESTLLWLTFLMVYDGNP